MNHTEADESHLSLLTAGKVDSRLSSERFDSFLPFMIDINDPTLLRDFRALWDKVVEGGRPRKKKMNTKIVKTAKNYPVTYGGHKPSKHSKGHSPKKERNK